MSQAAHRTDKLSSQVQSMNINTLKIRFSKKIKEMNRLRTQNRFSSFDPYTLRTDSERIEEGTQQALQRL